ncbi:MAG TPA: hypothetical protein VFQ45_10360 [Longimicrobium sp.]|nr:hypothetical protein [Longimicrobium sp.]
MKKLRLDLEALEVQTFEVLPEAAPDGGGTVRGFEDTDNSCQQSCPDYTCATCQQNTICPCDPVYYSEASCLDACNTDWTTPNAGCVSPNYSQSCFNTCYYHHTCQHDCASGYYC